MSRLQCIIAHHKIFLWIFISGQKPEMSVSHSPGELVLFTCSLPGPAKNDTRCNLYFGEGSHPARSKTIWKKRSSTGQWFCQFHVPKEDFLRYLRSEQQKEASCDYSLGSEPHSVSARSDRYSLTRKSENTWIHKIQWLHVMHCHLPLLKFINRKWMLTRCLNSVIRVSGHTSVTECHSIYQKAIHAGCDVCIHPLFHFLGEHLCRNIL